MELPVTTQFILLALNPEKGRLMIDNTHFRYSLAGAVLMDFLDRGEISLQNKRVVTSFRNNGEPVHDLFVERMERASKPARVSRWVRSMTLKSRFIYRETVNQLINKGILRHERRYFLNIIPYNRYFITEWNLRTEIISGLRDVLLNNKTATRKQSMLIGLLMASRSSSLLAKERTERRILRRKCNNFSQSDAMSSEIERAIQDVQTAIVASVTAATVASNASN